MGMGATRRGDLPRGTVTMLFADVEGSTRLLNLLGDRYLPVRNRSREIVRTAASAHRGHEVDWAGDGVFLAFERAADAVTAAADIQRALAQEPWAPDEGVRLRIGIHTGEPELDDEGYVGLDVVVAARICGAAHGGQVVVSAPTQHLAGPVPQAAVSFRPLGTFRLKDIRDPHELFQLVGPELIESFPPLATLGGGSLPTLHHRLVGRGSQLAEIEALLGRDDVRLVTITGPGGAGKSRLALEVATRQAMHRPVQLVGLASISDSELVPAAIARALEVKESPSGSVLDALVAALRGTHSVLYLDNLEHLSSAASHVRALLDAVPDLVVLATSRAPLRLSGERVLPLDPLTPDEAVEFFVELTGARGLRMSDSLLPTVRAICERVDCLPLAIELVAARLAVLSASQLLDAVGSGATLDLEGAVDLPERQRTLRSTLDWSYELLSPEQRDLHGALAVFAGGCTLEDARIVAGDPERFLPDLETLVLGSLVRGDASAGETRLTLLETVREHALDRLGSEERLDEVRARHARRFAELAQEGAAGLEGPEHATWADRLERELDNLRAALDWMLTSGETSIALATMSSLERFWRAHGHVSEARRWLALGLQRADGVPDEVRADALYTAARQAAAQSDLDSEVTLLEEALGLYRRLDRPGDVSQALVQLGWIALQRGDETRATSLCEEGLAVARTTGDPRFTSAALNHIADVYSSRGDHVRALAAHEEALALRRELGDPLLVADSTYNLAVAAFESGDVDRARQAFEESFALADGLGNVLHRAAAGFMLAELELLAGDVRSAETGIVRSLAVYSEVESDRDQAECLVVLGGIAVVKGALGEAARLFGAAEALRGDSPVNRFERPVLERFEPILESGLEPTALAAEKAEGRRLGGAIVSRAVVAAGSQE